MPQSEPQWQALLSRADELFYGGAAGGGKTDLVLGLATECHQQSVIFRRVYPNLKAVMHRAREIIDDRAKENKSDKIWTWPDGRTLEFGAIQYEDNKTDWQGRPHDLKAFDELPEFTKSQYQFAIGWNRSTDPSQRVRVVATGNPPINEAGSWVIEHWAAWLDKMHPNPAKPGELRWYAVLDGEEREIPNGEPFGHTGSTISPNCDTNCDRQGSTFRSRSWMASVAPRIVTLSVPDARSRLLIPTSWESRPRISSIRCCSSAIVSK